MKINLLLLFVILIHYTSTSQTVNIPDNNFKNYLINNSEINTNDDEEIQLSEAISFTGEIAAAYTSISSLTGLEEFVNLTSLSLYSCSLTAIDISNNLSLIKLDVSKNNLTTLNISNHTNLEELTFSENNITTLDVSPHTKLTKIIGNKNELTSLDLSTNTLLTRVDVSDNLIENSLNLNAVNLVRMIANNNKLTSVNLSKATDLQFLGVAKNLLTVLDLSENKILSQIDCSFNDIQGSLQLDSSEIFSLDCSFNELTSLDTSAALENLRLVNCEQNNLTSLNFTSNTKMVQIDCNNNQLTSLSVEGLVGDSVNGVLINGLQAINCQYNLLTSLNLSDNINLKRLSIYNNNISTLDVTNNTKLNNLFCSNNNLTALDLTKNTNLNHLDAPRNNLTTVDVRNGNNTKMSSASKFRLSNNPNLQCVFVDDVTYSTETWTQINASGIFVTNQAECNQALSLNSFVSSDVGLFPNPVKNILEINTNQDLKKVTFFNVLGKQIKTSTATKINVSKLNAGIYILVIELKNGTKTTKKVVKEL